MGWLIAAKLNFGQPDSTTISTSNSPMLHSVATDLQEKADMVKRKYLVGWDKRIVGISA
jgi:hypothetical protein